MSDSIINDTYQADIQLLSSLTLKFQVLLGDHGHAVTSERIHLHYAQADWQLSPQHC